MWTKVEEELPNETQKRYLVIVQKPSKDSPEIEIAMRYPPTYKHNAKGLDKHFIVFGKVTHWRELPDLPI